MVICSSPFQTLARGQARIQGVPDLPLALIDHPLGGLLDEHVAQRVEQAMPQVMARIRDLLAQ